MLQIWGGELAITTGMDYCMDSGFYSLLNHTAGQLSAVGSLNVTMACNSTLSLSWTAPFTLNITGVNPDINGYCVEATLSSLNCVLTMWDQHD